jgi:hypothetical protein
MPPASLLLPPPQPAGALAGQPWSGGAAEVGVAFADPELAAQATALEQQRLSLATAIRGELAAAAAGALPRHRQQQLMSLQVDHMRCLELLKELHLRQMRQHLASAGPGRGGSSIRGGAGAASQF